MSIFFSSSCKSVYYYIKKNYRICLLVCVCVCVVVIVVVVDDDDDDDDLY